MSWGVLRTRVVQDGVRLPVVREPGGWIAIARPRDGGTVRMRYGAILDRVNISAPEGRLEFRFRSGGAFFDWAGRRYRIGPLIWGRVTVLEGERPAITGKVTFSGVRINYVSPELEPIALGLAAALGYRAAALWMLMTSAGG